MKFTSVLVILFAGFAAAKGNNKSADGGNNGTSIKSQCKQVQKLTKLTELAANTTKLADKTNNNATKIADIQAKAAAAAPELATLNGNATLMDSCNVIFAENKMVGECAQMAGIEEANKVINNATLLAKVTDNNATKAEKFKAKVAAKSADLTAMQSNTTLTTFCAVQNDKFACKSMAKLAKSQALAANTTALDAKVGADKAAKFQAKLAKEVEAMSSMMANTTLLDTCKSLGITVAATADGTTAASTTTGESSKKPSAAVNVKSAAGGQIIALVSACIFAITML